MRCRQRYRTMDNLGGWDEEDVSYVALAKAGGRKGDSQDLQ